MAHPIQEWFDAFAFTQIVEIPVYLLFMERALRTGHSVWPRPVPLQILFAFGATAITHPVVWFVIPFLPWGSHDRYVLAAETFAVLVEAFYFRSLHVVFARRALAWSLVANGLSAGIGLTSRALFGWP